MVVVNQKMITSVVCSTMLTMAKICDQQLNNIQDLGSIILISLKKGYICESKGSLQ